MKKMSQRKLIEEGFGSLLRTLAADTARFGVRAVSEDLYKTGSKTKSYLKKAWGSGSNSPEDFLKKFFLSKPESLSKIRNIKVYRKGIQSFKLTRDPEAKKAIKSGNFGDSILPTKSPIEGGGSTGKRLKYNKGWSKSSKLQHLKDQSALYMADFEIQLRNPDTLEPINLWIPIKGLPLKEYEFKKGEKSYQLAADHVGFDQVMKDLISNEKNSETREALTVFNDMVASASKIRDNSNVSDNEPQQPVSENKNNIQKGQKSLLKQLQLMSR